MVVHGSVTCKNNITRLKHLQGFQNFEHVKRYLICSTAFDEYNTSSSLASVQAMMIYPEAKKFKICLKFFFIYSFAKPLKVVERA